MARFCHNLHQAHSKFEKKWKAKHFLQFLEDKEPK